MRLEHLVRDLGMRAIHTAIEMPVQYHAAADARAHRHIDESRLVLPGAPGCFAKCAGIGVIFHCGGDAELPR